jgi:hypothetical protein
MRPAPLVLALLLALTGFSQALAQARMAVATEVTVCTDKGSRVLTLDAKGKPVPAAHDCLACLLPALADLARAPSAPEPQARATVLAPPAPNAGPAADAPTPFARGPPALV